MGSVISKDVPPYVTVGGHPAKPHGINKEGLKRRGYSEDQLRCILNAYKQLYKSGLTLEQAESKLREMSEEAPVVGVMSEFLEISNRSIIR